MAVSHSGILDTHASSDANEKESQKRNVDSLKESDRLALAYHLATFLSSPKTKSSLTTPSTNTESKSVAKYKEKKVKKQPSLSSSTWKSLHLGSITNYLPSMPGMPNSSSRSLLPSVEPNSAQEAQKKPAMVSKPANPTSTLNKTSQATLKAEPGKRTVSGSAWIPTFGLFNTSASTSVSTARGQVKNGASTDSTVTNGPEPCIPELEPDEAVRVQKSEVGSQDERPEGEQLPISNSAATDTDIEAISEAILETISPQPNPTTPQEPESAQQPQLSPQKDDHATPRDTSVKSKFKAKWHSVCTIYVDNEYIARSCQLLSVSHPF